MQSAAHEVVLLVGLDNRAHANLGAMLNLAGYRALTRRTVCETIGLLNTVSAVICEEILPDGTWKDVLAALDRVHFPAALIVTSAVVEPRLWAEVLHLGGSDVLAQPLSIEEVLWVVRCASDRYGVAGAVNLDSPAEPHPKSLLELPENGHRCALMGTDRHAASNKRGVARLNHYSEAPSGWTGACSLNSGSQRSTFKR